MRKPRLSLFSLAVPLLFLPTLASAQVHEAAVGAERHLWVGGEFSDFNSDYDPNAGRIDGIGVYADYDVTHRFSLEGEARFLTLNKPAGQTQKNYLIGPSAKVYQYNRFTANVKILLGADSINYPYYPGTNVSIGYGSYFAFAPGGNVEYRLGPRLRIRGEYEYHFLPSAPGVEITAPFPSNGLTPNGFSVGVSYRIF